jgi:hypothetical protein
MGARAQMYIPTSRRSIQTNKRENEENERRTEREARVESLIMLSKSTFILTEIMGRLGPPWKQVS